MADANGIELSLQFRSARQPISSPGPALQLRETRRDAADRRRAAVKTGVAVLLAGLKNGSALSLTFVLRRIAAIVTSRCSSVPQPRIPGLHPSQRNHHLQHRRPIAVRAHRRTPLTEKSMSTTARQICPPPTTYAAS